MSKTALLLIDIQNDYFSSFEAAKWPLKNTEAAAKNAASILDKFRNKGDLVVHVRHQSTSDDAPFFAPNTEGAKTHQLVEANSNEAVVVKQQINSFRDTELKKTLDAHEIENVVIVGAMSHMCIDAVTRAAHDFGYDCTVIHDACATLDLTFNGVTISAADVHTAFMAALEFAYAKVISTDQLLNA